MTRALLVVTNARFRLLYRLLAREGGAEPLIADALEAAIQLVKDTQPSIIITDLDDPEPHWDLEHAVTQLTEWQSQHALIVSTSQASQWVRRHLPGAFLISKPMVADDIINTVRALTWGSEFAEADASVDGEGSGLQSAS